MSTCAVETATGTGQKVLTLTTDAPDACQGYIMLDPAEYKLLLGVDASSAVTSHDMQVDFGFGFGAIAGIWLLAIGIRAAKRLTQLVA